MTGIYEIRNTNNEKAYIGASQDIEARWAKHQHVLREGKHKNEYLQAAYDKHGEEAFEYRVIEVVLQHRLEEVEQQWIDDLNAAESRRCYNLSPSSDSVRGIERGPLSEEHKQKLRESMEERWADPDFREKMEGRDRPDPEVSEASNVSDKTSPGSEPISRLDIRSLRDRIDRIDARILGLLVQRRMVTAEIGQRKGAGEIVQSDREKLQDKQIRRNAAALEYPVEDASQIFQLIRRNSARAQKQNGTEDT